MSRAALATLIAAPLLSVAPALAQQAPAAPAPAPGQQAAPAAGQMTPDQIAAFNKAVTDFTAGQTAQQAGDNAGAVAKYEAALPAIRKAVEVDPGKIENVNFLANALYATAAAKGALVQMDQVITLYGEALPHWRKVVANKPADAASHNILAGILVQLGNQKLGAGDKAGADPHYQEALTLARKSVAENGTDKINRNLLLSALIGASQTGTDTALRTEATELGKAMTADGSIDAINKPSVDALTGQKAG
ncbi:MAG: hypothetical protein ABW164_10700 [Sphingobium sp.]